MELQGAVAIVTGGASGIGAAVAEALAGAGARPVVWDIALGDGHIECDVAEEESVTAAMARTVAEYGTPTVMVACAGVGGFQPVASIERAEWDRILGVNLTGAMLTVQAAAREMRKAGHGGSVVCISSVNGRVADRGMAAYCCSKAGVDMLVRVAAAELGPAGIRVNAVAPGVTDTPLLARLRAVPGFLDEVAVRTPLGGLGSAQKVADAVLALIRTDWITGESVVVDGGLILHSPLDVWSRVGRVATGPPAPPTGGRDGARTD